MSGTKVTVTFRMEETDDQDLSDVSYLLDTTDNYAGCTAEEVAKYVAQDAERYRRYTAGDWHFIGIRAVATIWIQRDGYRTNYTLDSPGLWGIESDSGKDYIDSIYAEECATLRADIEAMSGAAFK